MGSCCCKCQVNWEVLINRFLYTSFGQAIFMRQLEKKVADLRNAKDELVAQIEAVKASISLEETEEMERLPQVDNWLRKVDALVDEVEQILQTAPEEISRLCLGDCCSTSCMSSYKFGEVVARKLKEVREEKKGGVFDKVVNKAPVRPVIERNVGSTVGMETTFDKAWGLLIDNQVDTLGIWGMGGVGKTTLLKLINNEFLKVSHDYVVIYVVVSSKFTAEKVQDDIWKRLGFSVNEGYWKNKSHQEKVDAIFFIMNRRKFVLLLDDVWEQINLADDIGVPKERKGSKVVFTTRDEAVCGLMDAEKHIKVEALPWEKAWELFQQKVGQDTLNSDLDAIEPLAQDVAKECAGLPIALITVARSMACKRSPREWKNAIESLRLSASRFQGMNKVLAVLKFSYENLSDDTTRSCFLYCCLFPEDYKIPSSNLVDYWVGEGFCTSPEEGYVYIGTLVRACLLEEDGEHVKFHDVVRDMALWIACEYQEENERFLVNTGGVLTDMPEIENWKAKKRISLMDNRIENLVGAPMCPKLHTLFLCHNRIKAVVCETSGSFFQSMGALKVLDLSHNTYQRLSLDVSTLMSLQYLNLSHTQISELPPEFKQLVNLKYLNLDYTPHLVMIPRKVISSLSRLQVLRMYQCCNLNQKVDVNSIWCDDGNFLAEELQCLKHLNVLTTTVRDASSLMTLSSNPQLVSCIQALCLNSFPGLKLFNISSFVDMVQLEVLTFGITDVKELSVDSSGIQRISENRSFNNLRRVEMVECYYLLDLTWLVLLPNLKILAVCMCSSVREIINPRKLDEISSVHQQIHPFAKLEVLHLDMLGKLESINSSPLPVPSLRDIYVSMCPRLKKLPLDSNSARGCNLVIAGDDFWWESLEWEDESTKATFSSCFVSVIEYV